jgi:hypothetical protein
MRPESKQALRKRTFSKRVDSVRDPAHVAASSSNSKRGVQPYRNSQASSRAAFTLVSPPRHHLVDAGKQTAAAVIYPLLLAIGLVANGMGFPRFSTEPRATSSIAMSNVPPRASHRSAVEKSAWVVLSHRIGGYGTHPGRDIARERSSQWIASLIRRNRHLIHCDFVAVIDRRSSSQAHWNSSN